MALLCLLRPKQYGALLPVLTTDLVFLQVQSVAAKVKDVKEDIKKYLELLDNPEAAARKYKKLHRFLDVYQKFYHLTLLAEGEGTSYIHYRCSCPQFWQYRFCKQSIAYGLAKGCFELPPEKDMTVIGQKPRRGRPAKATAGWHRQ